MSNPSPAITDIDQLKDRYALAQLLQWNANSVQSVKFDCNELSIYVDRSVLKDACGLLKPDFNFFSDVTCVDWFPNEPRFHVAYHLLSHARKERVRLKVALRGDDAVMDSIVAIWPGANYFEREIFDLFGIRFTGHPKLQRMLMPDDWEGHPLRKDYPVEGYR